MQDQEMGEMRLDIPLSVEESVLSPECFDNKKSSDAQRWVPACKNYCVAVIEVCRKNCFAVIVGLIALCIVVFSSMSAYYSRQTDAKVAKVIKMYSHTKKIQELKINDLERKLSEAEEKLVDQTKCVDLIETTTAPRRCNWTTCETKRIDAPATSINATLSNTMWYPEDCSNHIIPKLPYCKTTKGLSALPMVRPHPKCQGQLQFGCSCEGQPPDYNNILEIKELDCTGFIKLCEKLKMKVS